MFYDEAMLMKTLFQSACEIFKLRYKTLSENSISAELSVSEICTDSRKIQPGCLFVAIKGTKVDSHDFLNNDVFKNCAAVVVQDISKVPMGFLPLLIQVENSRQALDQLAAVFHGHPSRDLFCIGVTGTNGKTSTTYLIEAILNEAKISCGVLGTVDHHLFNQKWPTEVTTPDPVQLQSRLKEMRSAGANAIAMEVSSHALDQHRADGVQFDVAVFTNLTMDHLDYHQSMENYFAAKARLFDSVLGNSLKKNKFVVINSETEWGLKIKPTDSAKVIYYGKDGRDISYTIQKMNFTSTDVKFKTFKGNFDISFPMAGAHNLENAMAAIGAALAAEIPVPTVATALQNFFGVPGRLQLVNRAMKPAVLVDYAHTPDALERVLKTLNQVRTENKLPGRIVCVFGCGGDRDKAKRPIMMKSAFALADLIIVTSDNPRTEDPAQIIQDILAGLEVDTLNTHNLTSSKSIASNGSQKVQVIVDRGIAIAKAIEIANADDVVLIAGKGHEDYQIVGNTKIHFSDFEKANEAIAKHPLNKGGN